MTAKEDETFAKLTIKWIRKNYWGFFKKQFLNSKNILGFKINFVFLE